MMLDLTNIQTIKAILRENNLWAQKKLGQNFLVAKNPLDQIIKSANIRVDDVVIEVGPGLGTLTQELAKKAKLVLAIEKDYSYVEWLRQYFKHYKNIKIIHDDILCFPISNFQFPISKSRSPIEDPRCKTSGQIPNSKSKIQNNLTIEPFNNYKLVANLPYNITSPVIRKFLEADNPPSEMVLTVQKEVAERICAEPGNSDRGILTVMVEFYGAAEIIEIVDRSCFWPIPKVDSAIIRIRVTNHGYSQLLKVTKGCKQSKATISNRERSELRNLEVTFFRIVKAGFSQKRRQIHNSLSALLYLSNMDILDILKTANIDPKLRAEDLNLADWVNLYGSIQNATKKRNIRANG